MPIYEYHCEECGHQFEIEQKITDDPLDAAPDCAHPQGRCELTKLLFPPAIKFEGEGWTPTHYGK